MDVIKITTIADIALGLIALVWAASRTSKILRMLDEAPNIKVWQLLRFLMIVFVVGYGFALYLVIFDKGEPLKLIFGFVFLFGALFVLLVVVVTTGDISFIKKSKLSLRRKNRQLEKVNSELDMFVYSTAHDLRSPLSSILGLVNLAEKTQNVEEKMKCLEMVKGRIEALDDFIQSIIQFSKNNKLPVELEKFPVKRCILEVTEDLELLDVDHKVRMEVAGSDFTLCSDSSRIKTILNNLISNAIKYHNPLIEDPYVRIKATSAGNQVEFSIEDNGIGIEEEYLDKIYNMFYRATEISKGSGLGLYVVKETVEALSGKIHVKSVKGQGTKFTVTLPNTES